MDQEAVKKMTAESTRQAMRHARRGRLEDEMTGRIRKAWEQLDVALDEVIRLSGQIKAMEQAGEAETTIESFKHTLAVEQARARGKAEILALIMPAPLDKPDAVGAEAMERWKAKQAGQKRETPGLRMVAKTVLDDVVDRPEMG